MTQASGAFGAISIASALVMTLLASSPAAKAQSGLCTMAPDARDASLSVLTCGNGALTVRESRGARYVPPETLDAPPKSIALEAGALLLEFHPSADQSTFEILTPIAVAAVRGTKWVVVAAPGKSSVFVVDGVVKVSRRSGGGSALLAAGQGVDVRRRD